MRSVSVTTAAPSDRSQASDTTPMSAIRFGPGGGIYRIVTTPAQTGGTHFAFEAYEPPGGGPPLHIHRTEDELFFVLDGEISFFIDGRVIRARAGETAFVPRGAAHCFKNISTRPARVLVLFTPGHIEGFFEFGVSPSGMPPSDEELIARLTELAPAYNLEVLGPSPL